MYTQSLFIKRNTLLFLSTLLVLVATLASTEKTFAVTMYANKPLTVRWTSIGVQAGSCIGSNSYNAGVWSGAKAENDGGTFYSYTIPANTFPNTDANYNFDFSCLSDPSSVSAGARIYSSTQVLTIKHAHVSLSFTAPASANPYDFTPTLSFSSNSYIVDRYAPYNSVTLTWNYSDPNGTCTASGSGWSGSRPTQSSGTFYNTNNLIDTSVYKDYTLTCQSSGKAAVVSSLPFSIEYYGRPAPEPCPLCDMHESLPPQQAPTLMILLQHYPSLQINTTWTDTPLIIQ